MNSFRKIRKNAKALSPVVASIILIAVTVAVSVVVAAWMGGMSLGLMGNAEQATITNIAFDPSTGAETITATIQNTGPGTIQFTTAYLNGVVGTVGTDTTANPVSTTTGVILELAKGASGTITFDIPFASATSGPLSTITPGDYTVKLTSMKGNNFVLTTAYNP